MARLPAGMLEGSRLLDAPAHHVSAEETINIAKDYEFLVCFTQHARVPLGTFALFRRSKM